MVSMKQSELSSTGSKGQTSPMEESANEIKRAKSPSKSGRSTKSADSSPSDPISFCLTLEEFLPILQEDLRALKLLGAKVKVFELPKNGHATIVIENFGFKDGDFYMRSQPETLKVVAVNAESQPAA